MLILCEDEYCHGVLDDCNIGSQAEHPNMGSFSILIDLQFGCAVKASYPSSLDKIHFGRSLEPAYKEKPIL